MDMQDISAAILERRVKITVHAHREANADRLDLHDLLQSVAHGEIIRQYADDKPYPSCLILSWVSSTMPLHSVWAYNAEYRWAILVTVYRPDPERWTDWRTRVTP